MENNIPVWKRPFDITFSILAILLFLPLMVLIAMIIKFVDKGNVIYSQRRVGFGGQEFKIFKFRTMYLNAEEKLRELLDKDESARKEWEKFYKLRNDPRITPIGRFLRKTSLDELPQLFNVLKGDMSVVGPRPVTMEELIKFYKDKADLYKSVRPGLTGYWQVKGRGNFSSYEDRVKMDIWYIKNQSFLLDLKIILKTVFVVFKMRGS